MNKRLILVFLIRCDLSQEENQKSFWMVYSFQYNPPSVMSLWLWFDHLFSLVQMGHVS
jgi:hypothetical protein